MAEYAFKQAIEKEPVFRWWVSYVLKKRDRIINKVKTRTSKGSMKFGINIPRNVKEALEYDCTNGKNYWAETIAQEYQGVKVAIY